VAVPAQHAEDVVLSDIQTGVDACFVPLPQQRRPDPFFRWTETAFHAILFFHPWTNFRRARMHAIMNTIIAYLAPLYIADYMARTQEVEALLDLARGVVRHGESACVIEVIVFGPAAWEQDVAANVRLRVLPIAYGDGHPLDVLSWDLPLALARADVVHIHQANTRSGEMGLLLAKLHGKPVCLSGGIGGGLGESLDISALADCLVDLGDPVEDGPRLARLYRQLAGGLAEAV
jgi:hypothetical protein